MKKKRLNLILDNLKKNKIKAVVFDIGGVLQLRKNKNFIKKYPEGVHEFVARKLNISIDTYFDSIRFFYSDLSTEKVHQKELMKKIADNLDISPKKLENLYKNAFIEKFKLNQELLFFAEELRKRKYKTSILSDMEYFSKEILIPKRISKKFDFSIVSCDVGFKKPSSKIYKFLIKKLKLKPSEILFIDNRSWNIKGSEKLGIKGILFKNNKQLFKQLFKQDKL
jgi:epoxide hydrolase-like predicted phosphatase